MRRLIPLSLVLSLVFAAAACWGAGKEAERLSNAAIAINEIMAAPDKGIPGDVLHKVHCIAVIPGMKKGAFIVGGQGGKGAVSCRKADGEWGSPSMLSLAGGSFGLQIGVQSTDVIMLFMNKRGAEFLTGNKFEIGGDASAAAGPVGRDATANTDAAMNAEIYTYSRSRGAFAGISLKGARVTVDDNGNRALYGRPISAKALLQESSLAAPAAASPFLTALNKYARK